MGEGDIRAGKMEQKRLYPLASQGTEKATWEALRWGWRGRKSPFAERAQEPKQGPRDLHGDDIQLSSRIMGNYRSFRVAE